MISRLDEQEFTKFKARKLTKQDAINIARLVATRKLTEIEACLSLDINPKQWSLWKNRHKNLISFDLIIARIKADHLSGLLDKIEKAGDDYEIELPNGKVINKRGDWRALAWIADKDQRFAPAANGQAAQVTIQIGIIHEQLKRVIGFNNEPIIEAKMISDSNEKRVKIPIRASHTPSTTGQPSET